MLHLGALDAQDRTLLDDDQCKYVAIFNIARKAPWGEGDGVRTRAILGGGNQGKM